LFAYGPADATAVSKPHHLLPHLNADCHAWEGFAEKEGFKPNACSRTVRVSVQDSLAQVLSMDDPRHGPAPPARRVRKPVSPTEASPRRRQPAAPLSPITHEQLTTSRGVTSNPCDTANLPPGITTCRRRNLSTWDTVNTITGQALPYSVSEHRLEMRNAWVDGKIQDSVAPPAPPPEIDGNVADPPVPV